jgi:hypothetical protein
LGQHQPFGDGPFPSHWPLLRICRGPFCFSWANLPANEAIMVFM